MKLSHITELVVGLNEVHEGKRATHSPIYLQKLAGAFANGLSKVQLRGGEAVSEQKLNALMSDAIRSVSAMALTTNDLGGLTKGELAEKLAGMIENAIRKKNRETGVRPSWTPCKPTVIDSPKLTAESFSGQKFLESPHTAPPPRLTAPAKPAPRRKLAALKVKVPVAALNPSSKDVVPRSEIESILENFEDLASVAAVQFPNSPFLTHLKQMNVVFKKYLNGPDLPETQSLSGILNLAAKSDELLSQKDFWLFVQELTVLKRVCFVGHLLKKAALLKFVNNLESDETALESNSALLQEQHLSNLPAELIKSLKALNELENQDMLANGIRIAEIAQRAGVEKTIANRLLLLHSSCEMEKRYVRCRAPRQGHISYTLTRLGRQIVAVGSQD